ncbi:hypothetical protein [Actinomadura violacea]|uniref:Uncharacterized protein n=1 Tax=Actinomadura violacea TaxID=2819934 RepID=A0ABS3S675_9ACTN|nr:hypothetical protein [Actinomadura violacea]MBO2464477.1 hypothetical protein [Actinomadura violacea]
MTNELYDDTRPCAAASRCAARTDKGPARTPRVFCDADRTRIHDALKALPGLHYDLHRALGERATTTSNGRPSGKPTPSLPIRIDLADLAHQIRETLLGWEERVRDVAGLPETPARGVRPGVALDRAVRILTRHLDALLALAPAAMTRPRADGADGWEYPDLDGADAGLEVLVLVHRCRSALGLTRAPQLLSAPCEHCGLALIERLDGAAGMDDAATCTGCGHHYRPAEYAALAARVLHACTQGADR